MDVKLPEVGENITSGQVISIFVKEGDSVRKDQDLIEIETDKASLPVPSPADGTVKKILVKEGQSLNIGDVFLQIESKEGAGSNDTDDSQDQDTEKQKKDTEKQEKTPEPKKTDGTSEKQPAQEKPQTSREEPSGEFTGRLAVIGGGPGGYASAFLAADLGMDVTLIDKDVNPGGVCLYRGCIPSKALLHAAKVLAEAREAGDFGIEFSKPKINLDKLRSWKESVVERLTGGLGQLSKQRKINYIQGTARFTSSDTVEVVRENGETESLSFDKIILATGSRPIELPGAPDSDRVLDSTTALNIESIPESMLLVGGGYIGLELGTVYAELGSAVSVVEMMPQLMTGADRDLAGVLEKRLRVSFKEIMVSTKITKVEEKSDGLQVTFEQKDGSTKTDTFEKILVAIGRRPNTDNLGLENTRIQLTDKGFIEVNLQRQTSDPVLYAIGDITGNPMLAHKASHEGRVAVEHIFGHKVAFEPRALPAVVFTDPEIAWAGLTETDAKAQDIPYVVAKFPWGASGRAITLNRVDGMTKLLVDPETEQILGVSIVGPGAGEMIAEGVLAIEMGANVTDLKLSIHPHPTLTETMMESAEAFFGQSTHIYRPKKK